MGIIARRCAAGVIVAAAAAFLPGAEVIGERKAAAAFVFTEASKYEPTAWMEGRDRFPAGATLKISTGGACRALAPAFHASADATISFDGQRVLFAGKPTAADFWQIWEVPLTGGTPRRVSASEGDCVRPLYLPDGRVVYTRLATAGPAIEAAPLAGGKGERLTFAPGRYLTDDVLRDGRILFEAGRDRQRELFTIYADGTGVEAVRCDHGKDRGDARQVSSGDVVFTSGARLARFTSALAAQTDVSQPALEPAGPVAEVAPETWILALRGKDGRFGLYGWDAATKQTAPLVIPPSGNAVQPVVVMARTAPPQFPSALVPTRTAGNLLCLDARASRTPLAGADIRRVRIYTRGATGEPVLLGQTVPERDGSFYVEVPADRPLRIELIDGPGRTVRAEQGWFWMRPSEQRVCVGCHTGPERAPENKVPEILLKTIVPLRMLGDTP
jgi:hypothetical protein